MPMPDTDTHHSEIPARQICHRRGRRDDLYARLGQDHARARHLGGAQRDPGCRAEAVRRRRHAVLSVRRSRPSRPFIAGDLGIRLNFYMDVFGGGSSTEALIGIAIGVIEAGMCKTVAIFRSMNGFTQVRIGGTGARSAAPVAGDMLHSRAYGWQSAGQMFAPTFMRHMYDYGTTPEQVAHVKVVHSQHASNNPKAYLQEALDGRGRAQQPHDLQAAAPARLLRRDRQRHAHHRHLAPSAPRTAAITPVLIRGVVGPLLQAARRHALPARADLDRRRPLRQGHPVAELRASGRRTSTSPAPTTPSPSPRCCSSRITASARRARAGSTSATARSGSAASGPTTPSGGHLCEGYTHGMNMVIENVRQLRHDVDDYCPVGPDGKRQHTYDYREGGCRQVKDCEVTRQSRLGQSRRPARPWSCGAAEGGNRTCDPGQLSRHAAAVDELDDENLDYFKHCAAHDFHLQRCAGCSLLRYPPTTACPWCMSPKSDMGAGRGQGRGALLHRGASRHPAGLQGAHALSDPAGRPRHAEGQADRARGAARGRQPAHAGRQAGAAGHGEDGSASARACAWCSPTWRRACRCRNGRSTRPRRSRPSRGAIRRSRHERGLESSSPRIWRARSTKSFELAWIAEDRGVWQSATSTTARSASSSRWRMVDVSTGSTFPMTPKRPGRGSRDRRAGGRRDADARRRPRTGTIRPGLNKRLSVMRRFG